MKKKLMIFILGFSCFFLVGCKKQDAIYELTYPDFFQTASSIRIVTKKQKEEIEEMYQDIYDILDRVDKLFNVQERSDNYITDVMKVNASSGKNPVKVDKEVLVVLKIACEISKISEVNQKALFDITIAPVWDCWDFTNNYYSIYNPVLISVPENISDYLDLVDYKNIVIDEEKETIYLKNEGMKLDFGGIAKGYAADKVLEYLKDKDITSGVIDIGKNIIVLGKYQDNGWRVSLKTPFYDELSNDDLYYYGRIRLTDKSIVTSGIYEKYVVDSSGKMYHHILDPNTGFPFDNDVVSVSVVCSSSVIADGLSTTLFALGLKKGMEYVNKNSEIDAIYVVKNEEEYDIYISNGLIDNFEFNESVEKLGYNYKGVMK